MVSDIKIQTLSGSGIKNYLSSIAKVRQEVLKELPYLQIGEWEADLSYLRLLTLHEEALAVVVFDGSQIVGVSTGVPLAVESEAIHLPWMETVPGKEDYFCFGLSTLLKPYRSRGISHHFFDLREAHVRHLKRFSKVCFISIVPPAGLDCGIEQANLELFWKKRGYTAFPEKIHTLSPWHADKPLEMKFWVKELQPYSLPSPQPLEALASLAE